MSSTLFGFEDYLATDTDTGNETGVSAQTEAATADVAQGQTEIDQMAQVPVDAGQSVEVLEQVKQAASNSLAQNGGMTPGEVVQAQIAIESVCQRLNMPRKPIFMSLESYEDRNRRGESTRLAIEEGIGNYIKNIWEKLKKFFKNLWEKIVGFFRKVTLGAESLEKNARKLKSEATGCKSKETKEDAFEDQGLADGFAIAGKVNTANVITLLKNHEELAEGHKDLFGAFDKFGKAVEEKTKEIEKSKEDTKKKPDELSKEIYDICVSFVKEASGAIGASSTKIATDAAGAGGEVKEAVASKPLINNKKWVIFVTTSKANITQGKVGEKAGLFRNTDIIGNIASSSSFKIQKVESVPNGKAQTSMMPVLSPSEMEDICEKVEKMAEVAGKGDEYSRDVKKWGAELEKIIDTAIKASEDMDKDSDAKKTRKHELELIKKTINSAGASFASYYSAVPAMNVEAGKLALRYVSKSISMYKDK